MRIPYRYASPWLGYLGYLSDRSMDRWNRIADEVDEQTYGTDKLLCDVLGFWSDATRGWLAALHGGHADLPRVFMLVAPTAEAACKEVPVFPPSLPQGDPQVAYLVPLTDDGPKEIDADNCRVCISGRPPTLVVHLQGLRRPGEPPLTAGVYQGLIHIGSEPVALLIVRVPPLPPQTPCPPAQGGGTSESAGG